MSDVERPLSAAISQGWEVADYSSSFDHSSGAMMHCFLVRRQGKAKVIIVRKKFMGEGVVTEELEV